MCVIAPLLVLNELHVGARKTAQKSILEVFFSHVLDFLLRFHQTRLKKTFFFARICMTQPDQQKMAGESVCENMPNHRTLPLRILCGATSHQHR
jgi:hypothetical protein